MAIFKGRGSAAGHLAAVAIVLAMMAPAALAVNHVIGGTQEWDFPPTNDLTYYSTWAANQTFHVGDTLQFEYTQAHDVVQYATQGEYTACAGTQVNKYTTGNDSIPLTTAGTLYYICSIPGHCTAGMKVAVNVVAAATPPTTTPTTPSPPATNSPPPPATTTPSSPNAASSGPALSMACLFAGALVAMLAFWM